MSPLLCYLEWSRRSHYPAGERITSAEEGDYFDVALSLR
jgi:hypothetical protein